MGKHFKELIEAAREIASLPLTQLFEERGISHENIPNHDSEEDKDGETSPEIDLKELYETLNLLNEERKELSLKQAHAINGYLNNTAYEYLPSRVQQTIGPLLNVMKRLLGLYLCNEFGALEPVKVKFHTSPKKYMDLIKEAEKFVVG